MAALVEAKIVIIVRNIELFPELYYILGIEVVTLCSQSIRCTQSVSTKNCKVVCFQKGKCSSLHDSNLGNWRGSGALAPGGKEPC